MIICIGPLCVPVWHLGVLALVLFRPLIDLFHRFCGSRNRENEIPQDNANTPGCTDTSRKDNEPYKRKEESGVVAVKSEDELNRLKAKAEAEGIPLFVDFGASWCGPCRRIAPVFARLAKSYSGIFASVDVDECSGLSDLPPALPTFKVYLPNKGAVSTMALEISYLSFDAASLLTGADQRKLEAMVASHATLLS